MWIVDIPIERKYGIARCCCVSTTSSNLHSALAAFGLDQRDDLLIEVSTELAKAVLERILAASFVDGLEAMPQHRASVLANEFVETFKCEGGRFFSNGDWADPNAYTWQSFTHSVYDGGLIAYGPTVSACVWVEEDD